MSLFISSFNNALLKSIFFSLLVFSLYSWGIYRFDPSITTFQNQWVANYSKAERYIYRHNRPRAIIVGSSMAEKLLDDELDDDVFNLALNGGSVLTGLNIIKKRNMMPDVIFIETNYIERALDRNMLDGLFTPGIWKIRGAISSLQYTYQPINIALSAINNHFGPTHLDKMNSVPDKLILMRSLKSQIQENSQALLTSDSVESESLKKLVNFFEKRKVKIVFFQMPAHKMLLSSKNYYAHHSILLSLFPDAEFYWVNDEVADDYQTSDGLHLIYKSASEFSSKLNTMIHRSLFDTTKSFD